MRKGEHRRGNEGRVDALEEGEEGDESPGGVAERGSTLEDADGFCRRAKSQRMK
jgi:hypothetical protein